MKQRYAVQAQRATVDVVLASASSRANMLASVEAFLEELEGRGTVWLVDASGGSAGDEAQWQFPQLRVLTRPTGALVPELWREGLLASSARFVAFSTTAMRPSCGWLDALLAEQARTGAAGVGGPIEPAPELRAFDCAVYLQRYASYHTPLPSGIEPPGDNALYERDALLAVEPAWRDGFWEVGVHRALGALGERLAMAPPARVLFQGGTNRLAMLAQRFAHARHHAAWRGRNWSAPERLLRLAATPCVPAVLAARAVRALRARDLPLIEWTRALPGLATLLAAWAAGEACGLTFGPRGGEHASLAQGLRERSDVECCGEVALSRDGLQR